MHIATPSGFDIYSTDGGANWRSELVPLPAGRRVKTISVVLDPGGTAHFAVSAVVHGPQNASTERASRGYWELLYVRRNPDGAWTSAENVLRGRPEWAEPANDDDVLADSVRIMADDQRNLHVTWHGTAKDRIYGNDYAYYAFRAADGAGGWRDTWEAPQMLVPADPARGIKHSFAPSLAVDGDLAVALAFYDVFDGKRWAGFDSVARIVRHGRLDGPPIPVAQWVRGSIDAHRPEAALATRFPAIAPRLYHAADRRVWLDVLQTLIPMGFPEAPNLIVYQRVDLSPWLSGSSHGGDKVATAPSQVPAPVPAASAERPADGTVLFTMGDILAFLPNLISRFRH